MANYTQILGKLASEKAASTAKGIARGAKEAFLSDARGISAAVNAVQVAKEQFNVANKTLVEQRKNNVISLQMVKELRRVNASITKSNVIALRTAKASGLKGVGSGLPAGGGAGGGDDGGGSDTSLLAAAGAGGAAGAAALSVAKRFISTILRGLFSPAGLAGLFVGGAFALRESGIPAVSPKFGRMYNTRPGAVASETSMSPTAAAEGRAERSGGVTFRRPIDVDYTITSRFREASRPGHMGIDLAPKGGKGNAVAAAEGTIEFGGVRSDYGNLIIIKHANGIKTYYSHLASIPPVYTLKGQKVQKDAILGPIGATGNARGLHLHFAIQSNGQFVDPEGYIDFGGGPRTTETQSTSSLGKSSVGKIGESLSGVLKSFSGPGAGLSARSAVNPSTSAAVGAAIDAATDPTEIARIQARFAARSLMVQAETLKEVTRNRKATELMAGGPGIPGGTARRGPPTQDQLRERYYRSQLESARQSFLSVTQRLINTTLLKTFFPRGFGVTRQQSLGMGYVGNLIGNEIGLTNKITGVLSKAFGKQYGQAYGQIFGRLGNVFIDKAANEFSKSIGFNPEDPTKFTFGQILGNFLTKGTKQQRKAGRRMGLEQLIYNYTGIPLGPSSLLSFLSMNPAMAGFRDLMGMTGNPMQYAMNPALALQQMSGAGANYITNPLFAGITGGFNMIPGGQVGMSMMQVRTVDGQRMYASQAAQANLLSDNQEYISLAQTQAQKGFFEGLGDTFMGGLRSLGTFLTGGSAGNLFSGGGSGGVGGGGGGDFFSNIAGAGANMLAMYGGYKIMQKIGGKNQNPLVTMLGTMAISQGLKIGAGMALDALGYGAVAKSLGLPTALPSFGGTSAATAAAADTAYISGMTNTALADTSLGSYLGSTAEGLTVTGATTATTGEAALVAAESGILGSTVGATTGGATGAAVGGEAATAALGGEAATAALGGEAATTVGATTATEGILAAAAETIPIIAAVYAVYRIINYFAFEKGDTRATYSIIVNGNNNINAGEIVHSEKTQESHWKLVENFGKAGFVMIKKLESQGVKPDFDYFTVQISFNPHRNVQMGFNKGNPGKYDRKMTPINVGPLDLRKPVDANVIKVIMDNMAKLIAERMSQTNSKSQAELQATLATITKSESEGNIEGLDSNVYKDAGGRTSYNEAIAAKAYEILETQGASGEDPGYTVGTGNMAVFNAKTGQYQTVSADSGILGYDAAGNPITRASLDATKSSASPVASGTNLTLQQVQNQNDELKNSNSSTATTNAAGNGTAVVNAGNVIDNSSKTTIVNQKLYDDNIVRFGAYTVAEFGLVSYGTN